MEADFSQAKTLAQAKFQPECMDPTGVFGSTFGMSKAATVKRTARPDKKPRDRSVRFKLTLIREWRKFRQKTQEELAAAVKMSPGNLSNIETGKQGYTQEALEAFARVLECTPTDLIERHPGAHDDLWGVLQGATETQRAQILKVARALVEKD